MVDDAELRLMYRVAVVRGISVVELLRTTQVEWSGWVAFHDLEPFGPRQEDLRAAYTVQAWAGSSVRADQLFPSLAVAPDRTGASFRAFAVANCPALANRRAAH